jgi:hypothetical protein
VAEDRAGERWIVLDFLGFSRPNRGFSMGCAGLYGDDLLTLRRRIRAAGKQPAVSALNSLFT